jgi:hypothetical protein
VRRGWLLGLAAATFYLGTIIATDKLDLVPVRPLYDGLAPPAPYRWVKPPADLADGNEKPTGGTGRVQFTKGRSQPVSVATDDGQASAVFKTESVRARRGEKEVDVTITPLDPAAQPNQEDIPVDGNVYRIEAKYGKSGRPVELENDISVVLRYPAHGKVVIRRDGRRWTELETDRAEAGFQAFADSDRLGIFAVSGAPDPWWRRFISYRNGGVLLLILGITGYLSGRFKGRLVRRRRKTRQQKRAAQRRREQRQR